MSNKNVNSAVISSLFWKLMERGGTQGIQFIVQIILARLLLPKDYGMVAIVMIFISLANVFVQKGFNTALIQKKEVDEIDLSTVFYINIIVAILIYIVLFFSAPIIAEYYNMPKLSNVLRVLSFTLFIGAFDSVQNAIISREMAFRKLFYSSLGAILISGFVGILTAYLGLGVWALVFQQLIFQLMVAIILWMNVKWIPKLLFSGDKAKTLFSFGGKILLTSLLDTLYTDLRTLIIGKIYTPSILGYYNRGKQFPALIITNVNGAIQSVMLPALSAQQDDKIRVKNMMRRSIISSSFVVFPLLIGLLVTADKIVVILLTEKWLPAVPFIQIYCLSYALFPIHTSNLQAINALGRSDIFLKLEIIKKLIGVLILIVSIQYGIYAIAIGELLGGFIATFVNAYPNKKLLDYSYKDQVKDIIPSFFLAIIMGFFVYLVNYLELQYFTTLVLQIVFGIIIYVGIAKLLKMESYVYIESTLRNITKRNN